jgi:mannose-6-phosphate isomerase-like protein (cupin superfamily)
MASEGSSKGRRTLTGMSTDTASARAPEVIAPGSGHHLHFLNHLATVKVRGGEDGALSVVEFAAARGLGPPLHRHDDEDELFVVLAGEVAFHCGDDGLLAGAGGMAFLPPRHPPHLPGPLRDRDLRLRDRFSRAGTAVRSDGRGARGTDRLGVPTGSASLPGPGPLDPGRVADVCLEHEIQVLGPPPAPLD